MFGWFRRKEDEGPTKRECDPCTHLVLFVHGLSGSIEGTWKPMIGVLSSDPDLVGCAIDCYAYPTSLVRLPLMARMPGIRELARGLATFIDANYPNGPELILVGHSLGGLVVRQYVLESVKKGSASAIKGVVLYASPNTGAALADIGRLGSWRHRHLKQLGTESDFLDSLNEDWIRSKIEDVLPVLYVVGGKDRVVSAKSAFWRVGEDNVATAINHDHLSIIKPVDSDDLSYKVLKNFVRKYLPAQKASESVLSPAEDVLFDVYSPVHERFYIHREFDDVLMLATTTSHAWVSGPSGVGKTAALRRLISKKDWSLQHIILGGYKGLGALSLLSEICNELCDRCGLELSSSNGCIDGPQLIARFKKVLRTISGEGPVAIFVEEIPLAAGSAFKEFLRLISHLATEVDETTHRVIWLFSSLNDPRPDSPCEGKFFERMQLLQCDPWSLDDISHLLMMIRKELKLKISDETCEMLVGEAKGNPRFVKVVLRRLRQQVGAQRTIADLVTEVRQDLGNYA